MKRFQDQLPFFLLFSYCVYSALIPTNIAHSIIIFSLVLLTGFQTFVSSKKTNKLNEEVLRELKTEFDSKLNDTKEAYAKKFAKLEDEVAKMHLNSMPQKPASSSPISPRKMVF